MKNKEEKEYQMKYIKALKLPIYVRKKWLGLLCTMLVTAGGGTSSIAYAQDEKPNCLLSSSQLMFGNYSPFSTGDLSSSSNVTVSCNSGVTAITLKLQPNFANGDIRVRYMNNLTKSGSSNEYKLAYSIFTDIGRTTIWGDGLSNTQVLTVNVSKSNNVGVVNFYGTLFKGQNVYPGSYGASTEVLMEF